MKKAITTRLASVPLTAMYVATSAHFVTFVPKLRFGEVTELLTTSNSLGEQAAAGAYLTIMGGIYAGLSALQATMATHSLGGLVTGTFDYLPNRVERFFRRDPERIAALDLELERILAKKEEPFRLVKSREQPTLSTTTY